MTAPRAGRASSSLFGTFVVVLVLFALAPFVWPQCGVLGASRAGAPERARPSEPRASGASAAQAGSEAAIASSIHVALGVPRDSDGSDDHFLDEQAFVLSYNPKKRVPNWVAWRLDRSYFGSVGRGDDFRPDPALPAGFYRVNESDYRHSGYDRGHLCPSGDRKDSRADNSRTFLFTNIEPQLHELNAGPWEQFEEYVRKRAQQGQIVYAVAGGVFSAPYPTIGNGVAVPAANFKIVVLLGEGQGKGDVSAATEVLSVMMPNQRGVAEYDWTSYLTTVDAIEQASGYDFLTAISEPVQRVIEARVAQPHESRAGRAP